MLLKSIKYWKIDQINTKLSPMCSLFGSSHHRPPRTNGHACWPFFCRPLPNPSRSDKFIRLPVKGLSSTKKQSGWHVIHWRLRYYRFIYSIHSWPGLFIPWIALSMGSITIQQIRITEINYVICWIVIFPVDSAIQRLNNLGHGLI